MLSAGTFKISSPLTVRSNTTLRGAGMRSTIIQGQSGASGDHLIGFNAGFSFGPSYNIVGGLSKGSTQIVTSSPPQFPAG